MQGAEARCTFIGNAGCVTGVRYVLSTRDSLPASPMHRAITGWDSSSSLTTWRKAKTSSIFVAMPTTLTMSAWQDVDMKEGTDGTGIPINIQGHIWMVDGDNFPNATKALKSLSPLFGTRCPFPTLRASGAATGVQ